jgi:hypothetical protein
MSKATERLERAVAREAGQTGFWKKLNYWTGKPKPGFDFMGADEPTPTLEKSIKNIPFYDLADPQTRILVAAAGHFLWGQPVPELSPLDIRKITNKIRKGQTLTLVEQLWIDSQQIDTDMF